MRTYSIINSSDVSSVDFSQVIEGSESDLRYSVDSTKTFVKFNGDTPTFLIGKPQYTQEEILPILAGAEWTQEI